MKQVRTAHDLGHPTPKPGYEWLAGHTKPTHCPIPGDGRWTVRRTFDQWQVIFHTVATCSESILRAYPPNDQGERDAKRYALALVAAHWEEAASQYCRDNGRTQP